MSVAKKENWSNHENKFLIEYVNQNQKGKNKIHLLKEVSDKLNKNVKDVTNQYFSISKSNSESDNLLKLKTDDIKDKSKFTQLIAELQSLQ
ncbi:Elf4 domain-containing protein [Alkaliphilus sp. B6464]|uniref:Elf4 domain-containing protein n=1 Tax=Alkaliphilus sp. B6464 TaxID=2731219 RepID=UPI001BA6DA32|nr:Elf4 domain-containing protein [Alkaliphilus sp. B6464]QUH21848.1 Elf4 domain-containing protein [Alkaliphilus sp. B6464]